MKANLLTQDSPTEYLLNNYKPERTGDDGKKPRFKVVPD